MTNANNNWRTFFVLLKELTNLKDTVLLVRWIGITRSTLLFIRSTLLFLYSCQEALSDMISNKNGPLTQSRSMRRCFICSNHSQRITQPNKDGLSQTFWLMSLTPTDQFNANLVIGSQDLTSTRYLSNQSAGSNHCQHETSLLDLKLIQVVSFKRKRVFSRSIRKKRHLQQLFYHRFAINIATATNVTHLSIGMPSTCAS